MLVMISALMFFLLPWYYTGSGQPQPVDIAVCSLALVFFIMRFPGYSHLFNQDKIYRTILYLSLYTIVVLLINYIISANQAILYMTLFNFYYVVLITVYLLILINLYRTYPPEKFYHLMLIFLLIDLVIPFVYFLMGAGNSRSNLSFNNPNQLGFFVLVNMSIFIYLSLFAKERNISTRKILSLLIININLLFLFLAASRACYPVIILYALSYPLIFRMNLRGHTRYLFVTISAVFCLMFIALLNYRMYLHLAYIRNSQLSANYSTVVGEVYSRGARGIAENFHNVWYFLCGSGLNSTAGRGTLEFHNNFMAVLSAVGLIGLLMYLYLNVIILKKLFKKGILYLLPYACYLFYAMFQYSYRTRVNWLMLAVVIFILAYDQYNNRLRWKNTFS